MKSKREHLQLRSRLFQWPAQMTMQVQALLCLCSIRLPKSIR
jgi:hypothetical protein